MRHGSLLSAVVLTTMAISLTSCSRNPVAPTPDVSGAAGAGTAAISIMPGDTPAPDGGTPGSETQSYLATSEGTMTVGRWTLWFRKNSLTMPATITMHVSDPEAMDVQISVSPPEANNFQSPVVLTANMSDVPDFDYTTGTMAVWNGSDWQLPGSKTTVSSHPNQKNVVAHYTTLANTLVTNDNGNKLAQ